MFWLLLAGALGAGAAAPPDPTSPGAGPSGAPAANPPEAAPTGGNPVARLLLLPDISAIGRGAMAWNQRDVATESPRAGPFAPGGKVQPVFQELEVALQAVVDPYARADVFLSFAAEGAGVEEAYLTTLTLPWDLQVKAGKLFAPFGRLNQQHPHTWDFVDAPLASTRLVSDESLKGAGADLAWLAPVPWFAELHLAYQETTPAGETTGRRTGTARLVQFVEVADGATLGVGLSGARLQEPGPGAWRDLFGADLLLRIRPPAGRGYLVLQGELLGRRLSGAADPLLDGTRLGGYAQALLRQGAPWAWGLRWETAPTAAPGRSGPEQRFTALATWFPSEFQRLRLQVSHDRLPGGRQGLEALLALEFNIGAHGAHPF